MNIRMLTIAAIAAIPTILPTVCGAADEASLNACAKVFATRLATHGMAPGKYHIRFVNRGYVETTAQYEEGIYTYDVMARDSKSGAVMASATCRVDEGAAVTAFTYRTLGLSVPALASR